MSERPIILVEDNEKIRRMYADMLEAVGYKVMRANDGEKAVELLHKVTNPELVILDIMMPRMDGIETCKRIRKLQGARPYPVIFLTALDRPETLLECLRAGGDDYIMKSTPVPEVLERVRYWSQNRLTSNDANRRERAIRELEAITTKRGGDDFLQQSMQGAPEPQSMTQLADFLASSGAVFDDGGDALYRFGYLVGLVATHAPQAGESQGGFKAYLRNLVFKTNFVDRQEIDALLENYERIVNQTQFREGWSRGRGDAEAVSPA